MLFNIVVIIKFAKIVSSRHLMRHTSRPTVKLSNIHNNMFADFVSEKKASLQES